VGARRVDELIAWQLAQAFKLEVYRLIRAHRAVERDLRFTDQLRASTSSVAMNIAEGFHRYHRREFSRFLQIALSSLGEAMEWLRDGADRGHYSPDDCAPALTLARRCYGATLRLKKSLTRPLPTDQS
jgi:four helix bundle protein